MPKFRLALSVKKLDESPVGVFFSEDVLSVREEETITAKLSLHNHQLSKGKYYLNFSIGIGDEIVGIKDFDIIVKVIRFEIAYSASDNERMIGFWDVNRWGSINFANVSLKQI